MIRRIKQKFIISIYDVIVYIIISNNVSSERKRMEDIFGPSPTDDYRSLCSYNKHGEFALFFEPDASEKDKAHELFHLTHRILDYSNGRYFVETDHEQGARLCGYLSEIVRRYFND